MQIDTSHMSLGLLRTKLETPLTVSMMVMVTRKLIGLLERQSGSQKKLAQLCDASSPTVFTRILAFSVCFVNEAQWKNCTLFYN